ncbi:hypothetical protein MLPF_1997 [Mycobacterium lepromatosis]|nr:hypothetical protein MLPF_1997 [Mycobacterium lepromatosis]
MHRLSQLPPIGSEPGTTINSGPENILNHNVTKRASKAVSFTKPAQITEPYNNATQIFLSHIYTDQDRNSFGLCSNYLWKSGLTTRNIAQ